MGMCESMWKPGLEPEELFETVSQCLLAGADRDCLSGWGATVYIICPDNDVSEETDRKRIAWAAADITERDVPLSRWCPDYKEAFAEYMREK